MAVQTLRSLRRGFGRDPALPSPPGGGPCSAGVTLDQIRTVLRRHLSLVVTVVAVGTGLAALAGYKLTPEYAATAQVVIDRSDAALLDVIDEDQGRALADSTVETEIELITSRSLLGRVMADQGLFDDPEFRPPDARGGSGRTIALPEPLRTVSSWLPTSWLVGAGFAEDGPPAGAAEERLTPPLHPAAPGRRAVRRSRG